jgi:hypothetical protein
MGSFREEFYRTESCLIRNLAAIKERFVAAAINLSALAGNKRELEKMPKELRDEFLAFYEKISSAGPGGKGAIYNTIMPMDEGEVQMLVDEFLGLLQEVKRLP